MECPWAAQMPLEPTGGGQAPAASRDSDSVPLPASLHFPALAHDNGSVPSRHPARFAGFVPAQEGSPRIKGAGLQHRRPQPGASNGTGFPGRFTGTNKIEKNS